LGHILQDAFGVDARKIDHFIKGQFSYFGNAAVKMSDIGREGSRYGFDITDTGIFKRSPAYNSPAVQDFVGFAKGAGLTLTPGYKDFTAIANAYFSATTDQEKDSLAKELIDYAKMQLEEWKEEGVLEEKLGKKKEKEEEEEAEKQNEKPKVIN
jgi:hypothetical protein